MLSPVAVFLVHLNGISFNWYEEIGRHEIFCGRNISIPTFANMAGWASLMTVHYLKGSCNFIQNVSPVFKKAGSQLWTWSSIGMTRGDFLRTKCWEFELTRASCGPCRPSWRRWRIRRLSWDPRKQSSGCRTAWPRHRKWTSWSTCRRRGRTAWWWSHLRYGRCCPHWKGRSRRWVPSARSGWAGWWGWASGPPRSRRPSPEFLKRE